MSQTQPSSLDKILSDIDSSQNDLQEIFTKRTKGLKKVDISKTHDILDDLSIQLAFDFETAKGYFTHDNPHIPSRIDRKSVSFEDFITILKLWLKNVAFLDESENEKSTLQKEATFDKTSINPNYIRSSKRWAEVLDTFSEKFENQFLNYVGEFLENKTESDQIVTSNQQIQENYKIKEIKVPKLKNTDTISVQDLQMVLRGFFYDDSGYVLVENPKATEDFFSTVNSYKTLLKCIERYFKEFKKKGPDFNYKQARVNMAESMEIFDFFLRTDPSVAILEENEFNKNINQKAQKEEEARNQENDPRNMIRETLIETIVKYQKALDKCKTEDEKKILAGMINTIKQQLNNFRTTETTVNTNPSIIGVEPQNIEISPIPKKNVRIVDKKKRNDEGLKEIFIFIAKQGHVVGKNATFERVQHESQILSLGEFFFFCKTFNLYNETFDKKKAQELFKKTGESHKEVTFPDFKELLAKVSNEIYKNEVNMNEEAKMDGLCLKLGIDVQKSYKEKLHYTHLPFSSIDKEMFRFLPESITRNRVKPMVGKSVDEIREDIKRRKEERENNLKERLEEKSRIQAFKKNYEKVQGNQSISLNRSKEDNYSQLQVKSSINKFDLKNKITWDKLENISYSDLKALNDDNFKPTDLFDDNYDEEDQYYLAEYSLTNDKVEKEKQNLELKKNIEEYGKIKQNLRPTQKYQLENSKILNNESVNESKSVIPGKTSKGTKAANLSSQILDRANQIDMESKKKEKQLLKNIDEIQSNQLKKGLKTVPKKKIPAN